MPYHVIKYRNGYVVANQHTGKHYSKHPLTKEQAAHQMSALYAHMRAQDIRPQVVPGRPHDILEAMNPHLFSHPQIVPKRPHDIVEAMNPHLRSRL